MKNIKFKDVLMKALYMEEGKEQINVAQGSEFLKCVLEILANDYTNEEILSLVNEYREVEELTDEFPEEWAYPNKNSRTQIYVSPMVMLDKWVVLPLDLLINKDTNKDGDIKATDMKGNILKVERDLDIIYGPRVYYIDVSNLNITDQTDSISIMIYHNL